MIKRDFKDEEEAKKVAVGLAAQAQVEEPQATVRFSIKDDAGNRICCGIQPTGAFRITSCNFEADPLFKNLL